MSFLLLMSVYPVWFSDMDDTLYPLSSGLNLACRRNIQGMCVCMSLNRIQQKHGIFMVCNDYDNNQIEFVLNFHADYMLRHLNIEESEVPRMCLELYKEYGTTMAGLKVKQSWISTKLSFRILFSIHLRISNEDSSNSRHLDMNLTMMSFMLLFMEDCPMTPWSLTLCWGAFSFPRHRGK